MRKINGFTLIELIIVILIIGIIAAMSSNALLQGTINYTTSQTLGTLDAQAADALERISRIARTIPTSSYITTATSSQFSFKDKTGTSYSYQISSGNLVENANILSSNASTLVWTYYDKTGATTTTTSAIRFAQAALTLTKNNFSYTYTTSINLTNLL